jgi:hypothetical protein
MALKDVVALALPGLKACPRIILETMVTVQRFDSNFVQVRC